MPNASGIWQQPVRNLIATIWLCRSKARYRIQLLGPLLSDKAKLCEEYGIELKCRLDFPANMPIDNARLCIILSNLIDNAIRACRELTEGSTAEHKPFISLKVNEQFGYLVIRQENSFNGIVENRRSGAFSEHGLGLEIIKSIADELKGELVTEHDNKVFVTSVGVPLA